MSRHDGRLEMNSEVGMGTEVALHLARASIPPWYTDAIDLREATSIVVIDDDRSIQSTWAHRLAGLEGAVPVQHVVRPGDMPPHPSPSTTVYLVDYDLKGFGETGIDLVKRQGLTGTVILVTSKASEQHVQDACAQLRLSLLPKDRVSSVRLLR